MKNYFQKIFFIDEERDKNPDGLTWSQFVEKYPECKHIAILCWYAGCYPDELKQELKNLLEDGEQDAWLKEQEAKPLRCKECSYHRDDGWCNEYGREVKESDYCSFGAWEGR